MRGLKSAVSSVSRSSRPDPPVVAEPVDGDPLDDTVALEALQDLREVRVAIAGEVRADVRDAAGAERPDRVGRRAVRDFLVGQSLVAARPGAHAAREQVPDALGAVAAADAGEPAHPHQVEHAVDVGAVRPAVARDATRSCARSSISRARSGPSFSRRSRMWARNSGLVVPPGVLLGAPGAALGRLHREAVDREVLAEHVARLVRPVLEQRALLVGELVEQRLVERAVAAEEHEQVVAGDDRGRVELQAAQGLDGVEQVSACPACPAGPARRGAGCGSRAGGWRRRRP